MAVSSDQIQALYIAYFNRPGDFFGLTYQQDQANRFGLSYVADQFSKSPEYLATYAGKSTAQIVDTIYMNLFGRPAEPSGMKFWTDLLNNPNSGVTVGNAAQTVYTGAINGDKTSVTNKLKAANIFYATIDTSMETASYSGTSANAVLKTWLAGITSDASLAAATSAKALQDLADAYIYAYAVGDTSAASAKTVTIDNATSSYAGGAGADIVTLSTAATTKGLTLGDGNDTLKLASGTTTLAATLAGGDGIDTLHMFAADAASASTSDLFAAKFDGFEKLSLAAVAAGGAPIVNLAKMDNIGHVITAGIGAGGALTLDKLGANSTVELTGAAAGLVTTAVLANSGGTADVLKLIARVTTAAIDFGTVKADGVETFKLNLLDSDTKAATDTATLTLTGDLLRNLELSGNAKLVLTAGAGVVSIDAVAMTGALTAGANGTLSASITGGAGDDQLTTAGNGMTLIGGAGKDTLHALGLLDVLTGGSGNDVFDVSHPVTNLNSYTTITDLAKGDMVQFSSSSTSFKAGKVVLADTAVLQDFANYAVSATDAGDLSWFVYKGNTYVLHNVSNNANVFVNGTDQLVRLTGVIDLGTASYNASSDTLLIV